MISFKRLTMVLGAVMMMASAAFAQNTITVTGNNPEAFSLTDTGGNTLSATIALGALTPSNTNALTVGGPVTVRMRSNKAYKITAQASALTFSPGGAVPDGGDTIAAGFNYNPSSVAATNGLTPYSGVGSGRATLADIIANPNLAILSGPKIANNEGINNQNNFLTVTITFGLVGQFFTPSTLSGILTVTLVDGP